MFSWFISGSFELSIDADTVVNSCIYNSITRYTKPNEYLISFSEIDALGKFIMSDCIRIDTLIKSMINDAKKLDVRKFKYKDYDYISIFDSYFMNKSKNDIVFEYSFHHELNSIIFDSSFNKVIIEHLKPRSINEKMYTNFMDSLDCEIFKVLLVLIESYYKNYLDKRWKLYNDKFSVHLSEFDNVEINMLKKYLNMFSLKEYWIYVEENKIPLLSKIVDKFMIYDLVSSNPLIDFELSLEFKTFLRDEKVITKYIKKLGIDTHSFKPI